MDGSDYLYYIPNPQNAWEKLQNLLGKFLEITGKFVGLLCVQRTTSKYEITSEYSIIWSNFILIFQWVVISSILVQHIVFVNAGQFTHDRIDSLLQTVVGVAYALMMGVLWYSSNRNRKKVVNILNEVIELKHFCKRESYSRDNKSLFKRKLLIKLSVKMLIDTILVGGTGFYQLAVCNEFICHGRSFLLRLSFPIVMTTYCFMTTAYYITFAFEACLLRYIHNSICNVPEIHKNLLLYEKALHFGRNSNTLFQSIIALYILEGLIAFINMVKVFLYICVL